LKGHVTPNEDEYQKSLVKIQILSWSIIIHH